MVTNIIITVTWKYMFKLHEETEDEKPKGNLKSAIVDQADREDLS